MNLFILFASDIRGVLPQACFIIYFSGQRDFFYMTISIYLCNFIFTITTS